jgi:hypothetical protein
VMAEVRVDRLKAELYLLGKLEDLLRKRHVGEPRHSRLDHDCPECEALADLAAFRRDANRKEAVGA